MSLELPEYRHPDFDVPHLANAPDAAYQPAEKDGVAPEQYHSTSMYPEYFKISGRFTCTPWILMNLWSTSRWTGAV